MEEKQSFFAKNPSKIQHFTIFCGKMRFIRVFFEKPIAFLRAFCYNSAINAEGGRDFVPFAHYLFI
ncbi:MAG: hypothetical protein J6B09_07420 [Clostridia bacterium]|nr:hypothetical protein [Clostridia bacterium]